MEETIRCGVRILSFNDQEKRYILSMLYLKNFYFFIPRENSSIMKDLAKNNYVYNPDLNIISKIRFFAP